MIIKLSREIISLLIEETEKNYPFEVCGALFGDMNEEAHVKEIALLKNILKSSTKFQINPEEFLSALLKAEAKNLRHIGFVHSHPASPAPSITDLEYMKLWPELVWLIVSSVNYDMAAYIMIDGELREVRVKIENIH